MILNSFDCGKEIIAAIVNASWLPAGKAFHAHLLFDNRAEQSSISVGILEQLLLLRHCQSIKVFQDSHLHFQSNRRDDGFDLILLRRIQ